MNKCGEFRLRWGRRIVIGGLLIGSAAWSNTESDPAWYQRQATWEETVRVSREALMKVEAEESAQAEARLAAEPALRAFRVVTCSMTDGQKPEKIKVAVTGLRQLYITCRPVQGFQYGVVGLPTLVAADGKRVDCNAGWPGLVSFPQAGDFTSLSGPVGSGAEKITRGFKLGASELRLDLAGQYEWFEATLVRPPGRTNVTVEFVFNWRGHYEEIDRKKNRRQQIWRLAWRDFQAERVTLEKSMTDSDGIWSGDWKPGDLAGFAQRYVAACQGDYKSAAKKLAQNLQTPQELESVRELYRVWQRSRRLAEEIKGLNGAAVRRAIDDLEASYPGKYAAAEHRQALERFEKRREELLAGLEAGKRDVLEEAETICGAVRAALLANPLLDFDRLLIVRRDTHGLPGTDTGLVPANFLNHASIQHRDKFENEIALLSNLRGKTTIERFYKPSKGQALRDVRLDFDARKLLFSSIDANGRWAVYEIGADGQGLKQLTPTDVPDVDFFDPCRLPNGKVIVASTANYFGLPCLGGSHPIASLYLLDPATRALRQLTFDQDSDTHPFVMQDGRVLYQRWEYSDIPHYFSRRRFVMNPDGTGQLAIQGSNSWFPTVLLFNRPVPDHPTRMVGILGGHHDIGDCGRMVLLDPGLSESYPFRYKPTSKEWGEEGKLMALTPEILPAQESGFIQLIPGWGKPVAGTVCDPAVTQVYRKENPVVTTHPFPLSSKYFLVSQQPAGRPWGIYLVDIFDNATLLAELAGSNLFEPVPLMATPVPPVIPERIKPDSKLAEVHIANLYNSPGLRGVPPGTIKSLRLFSYHFGYYGRAGYEIVGAQSGWDVKRVLGTATVEPDGSAFFLIPANTPVSIQPLDGEGRAVQLMRSWLVGMPGERVSCVGCHEKRMATLPTTHRSLASQRAPEPLKPWCGSPMPFGFRTGVYPVLEKYCIGCHNDKPQTGGARSKPCFKEPYQAYMTLHPYVHRPGQESDMALHRPMEYHASTSPLIQLLEKGHHGVRLDALEREARERLYCWIDLNVPYTDRWQPGDKNGHKADRRRLELAKAYANVDADPECEASARNDAFEKRGPIAFVAPPREAKVEPDDLKAERFPMSREAAAKAQGSDGVDMTVDLGGGVTLALKRIPAGEFILGSLTGAADERPRAKVKIGRGFWMGLTEVTNAQYAQFDPTHDTRYIDMHNIDRVTPGYIANHPNQPVARISWQEAMAFCTWLSQKSGLKVTLPTEAQWEWAARAGTSSQFFYGNLDADFGQFANLADQSTRWNHVGFPGAGILQPRMPYAPEMNFPLHDERFKDKWHVVDYVGQCEANAWGLKDMVGNVSEWTRSSYRPYPYAESDGRNDGSVAERKVARGGSWADRPVDAGSAVRYPYESWQKVYNVGFRVIVEEGGSSVKLTAVRSPAK